MTTTSFSLSRERRAAITGFSVGGEILLEAAAQSTGFKAVVSEGADERVGEADVSGPAGLLGAPLMAVMTAATTLFSSHGPPPDIVDRIGRIAPRSVFLIYAEPGMGGEDARQPKYYAAAGEPKKIWGAGVRPYGRHRRPAGRARAPRRRLLRPRSASPVGPAESWAGTSR